MQIAPFERVRSLHVLLLGLLLPTGSAGLLGCASPSPNAPTAAFVPADTTISSAVERDSALSVLTELERTAFDSSFTALADYGATRYVRTEQMTPTGTTTAVQSYAVRYRPGTAPGTLQWRDSTGVFRSGGVLSGGAAPQAPTDRPANLAPEALPDRPPYLAPRTREAYRYALRADSLRDGTPTWVVTARARPDGPGQDQGVRYAQLILTRDAQELVGITVVRADRALLFSEQSRLSVHLRRAPDRRQRWVPYVTRFRASVHVPFRNPRQFRRVSAYFEYRR